MSRRTEKISSQLLSELARLLRQEVSDPRVGLVTLTRIDVAPDLSNAVVYFSALTVDAGDAESESELEAGLASAAPFLRRRAAQVLPLKRMPELRFRYDPSLVLGSRTLAVLREVGATTGDSDPGVAENGADATTSVAEERNEHGEET